MKRLRVATLHFGTTGDEWKSWSLSVNSVDVKMLAYWERDEHLHFPVVAEASLPERPSLTEDGLVTVPAIQAQAPAPG